MIVFFKSDSACRASQILVSDTPDGKFTPLAEKPSTSEDWECLDGSFMYHTKGGKLLMIWSCGTNNGYVKAVCVRATAI